MSIRPEDLTRSEQSRTTATQTLGGAWADSWGPGIPSVTLAGTTGWGAGDLPDGFAQFQRLHEVVFEKWHRLRAEVVREGRDPDGIKLVFSDGLDDFVWSVAPMNFVLKRNRTRPLLSQYQIFLLKTGDAVLELPPDAGAKLDLDQKGLESLDASIGTINDFANNIRGAVASALGPLKSGVDGLLKMTSSALSSVRNLVGAGLNTVRAVAGPVLEIAQGLSKVAANVFHMAASIEGLPQSIKNEFMKVSSALTNAFCLLRNIFKGGGFLPEYTGLYGSSYCSSTAGGSPVSAYAGTNVFPQIFPAAKPAVSLTAAAESAMGSLASLDPLKSTSQPLVGGLLNTVNAGVSIATSAIDNAIVLAKQATGSNSSEVSGDGFI